MAKIIVKGGDVNDALRRFSRVASETRKTAKKYEYYLRPGLKAKEKSKEARRFKKKF
jgi:small subunit ribosomal protein S21